MYTAGMVTPESLQFSLVGVILTVGIGLNPYGRDFWPARLAGSAIGMYCAYDLALELQLMALVNFVVAFAVAPTFVHEGVGWAERRILRFFSRSDRN